MNRHAYLGALFTAGLALAVSTACVRRPPAQQGGTPTPGAAPQAATPAMPSNLVVIIQGTASLTDPGDRGYARGLALRLSRWLDGMGIRHTVINDEQAAAGGLRSARVAIMPLNPKPSTTEMQALRRFVASGGRLIVCYGTDRDLADLMRIRPGIYRPNAAWSSFTFNSNAPPHVPRQVLQRSPNIFSAAPADGSGKVIATWDGGHARRAPEPAWIRTPAGYWMTHVLLDGDAAGKKQLCLALLGDLAPELWGMSAAYWRQAADTLGRFPQVLDILVQRAEPRALAQVNQLAAQARQTHAAMTLAFNASRYPDSIVLGIQLLRNLGTLYAHAQRPAPEQFRGIWNQSGTGLYPGDWPRTCRELAGAGFNTVIQFVHSPGVAHYASSSTARSPVYHARGDQLRAGCEAARAAGLKIHAWKICWNMEDAAPGLIRQFQRQGRLQVSDAGAPLNWLCPSHPANRDMEKESILEIVRAYPVDGIQLDYIRYRDSHYCFCQGCRKSFESKIGRRLRRWPADVRSGELAPIYRRWRADVISSFVAEVRQAAKAIRPAIAISAAVYGYYPRCIDSIGQDWGAWLAGDNVDFLCPMNYTTDLTQFTKWTRNEMALPGARGRIFPGIGVTATESRLTPIQVIDQILCLRREGATGFILYELNDSVVADVLPLLKLGVTAETNGKAP